MARTGWAAVKVALFDGRAVMGGGAHLPAPRPLDLPTPGSQCAKDRIEPRKGAWVPPDHQTVAPLHSPDSPTGARVEIANPDRGQPPGSPDIILEMGIPPIDDDVVGFQKRSESLDCLLGRLTRGNHDPDGAWATHLCYQVGDRRRPDRSFSDELVDIGGVDIVDRTRMPTPQKPPNHVGPHSAKPNHCQFHKLIDSLGETRPFR